MAKEQSWNVMSKVKHELKEKMDELETAKDNYRDDLVAETIQQMMDILKEEGTLSQRDFNLFIGGLARDIKNIYNR